MERIRFDITSEQMAQAAPPALRPIYRALEDRQDDRAVLNALSDAFVEGVRFGVTELVAQLIEAGADIEIEVNIT
jgi:hypothetical protein